MKGENLLSTELAQLRLLQSVASICSSVSIHSIFQMEATELCKLPSGVRAEHLPLKDSLSFYRGARWPLLELVGGHVWGAMAPLVPLNPPIDLRASKVIVEPDVQTKVG